MLFRSAFCFSGLLALSALSANAADNEPPTGFASLFNAKDLSGWHGVSTEDPRKIQAMSDEDRAAKRTKSLDDIKQHWSVQGADLVNDGFGLYLTTDKDYDHYELWIDYKTVPKADSGIYLKGAPQVQIWDFTDPTKFSIGADKGSGGLWNNRQWRNMPLVLADKKPGEWNTFFIRMVGEKVSVWLNDTLVVDRVKLEDYWSKGTKPLPRADQIELQHHGSELFFKNIFLRELPW